jgi:hypothetical protein
LEFAEGNAVAGHHSAGGPPPFFFFGAIEVGSFTEAEPIVKVTSRTLHASREECGTQE